MTKLCFAVALMVLLAVSSGATHQAPAPSVDCSTLVLKMADCLSYVTNGSTVTKPEGTCCSGLKTVLKSDAECLCETFKSSAQFGVVLNVTKAFALPSACGVSAPSVTNCGLSVAPGAAPGLSPKSSPAGTGLPPTSSAAAPTTTAGANDQAAAPAPASMTSSSSLISISFGSLVIGLVVASLSSF